ncbi:MAG: pirin family protein [Vicingaceae bacterium]
MEIQVIKKNQQARGQFNGGEILENKPIGFPREGGHLKPYSNLFYWAHAHSDNGSTIGLHPHQGFEIMSFVLKGSIEHYDTSDEEWKALNTGAAQIIRAGNGISHSEKLNPGSHMFQIWFDPNLQKTLEQPASYNDYPRDAFPVSTENGVKTIIYKGEGSPLKMDSPGVEIKLLELEEGTQKIQLDEDKTHSYYLIEGELDIEKNELEKDDFLVASEAKELTFEVKNASKLFMISNPSQLDYTTYANQTRRV